MENKQLTFLMHPKVFKLIMRDLHKLKEEFVKVNGDTYQKYITIMLGEKLTSEQKEEILKSQSDEESAELLNKFNINFSSEMT